MAYFNGEHIPVGVTITAGADTDVYGKTKITGDTSANNTDFSVAFGQENCAGYLAHLITAYDSATLMLTLDSDASTLAVGDVINIDGGVNYSRCATIAAIDGSTVTVDQNIVDYNGNVLNPTTEDHFLYVIGKPSTGTHPLGEGQVAIGLDNHAAAIGGTALGRGNRAYGRYSAALGRGNQTAYGSVGLGRNNKVYGMCSVGGGDNNTVEGEYAAGLGQQNEVRAGYSFVAGFINKVLGRFSAALGRGNEINGSTSFAVGLENKTSGNFNFALGRGNECREYHDVSFVLGNYNVTEHASTYAIGSNNVVSGISGTAIGNTHTVSGRMATALGYKNTASGDLSTAITEQNKATGGYSFVGGFLSEVAGKFSIAFGRGLKTTHEYQAAFGAYNVEDADAQFTVGNGTNDAARKNAFVVKKDGSAVLQTQGMTDDAVVRMAYLNEQITALTARIAELEAALANNQQEG